MSDSEDREALIGQISQIQRDLGRSWAQDRSLPFLASTLTMQQLKVVVILAYQGSVPGQELAQTLGVGLGTVTGIVDRLIARGLVTRQEDPTDRRIRRIALSASGRALADELLDAGIAQFRRVLELLDTEDLRALAQVMRKLRAAASRLR